MRSTILSLVALAMLSLTACTTVLAPPGPRVKAPAETPEAFVMPDGVRLPVRIWLPKGAPERQPAAVVLALHGMNDSRDAWEIPAPEFAAEGIALYSPDQRGFGGTTSRGYWPSTQGLVDDARVMTRLLHQRYPGVPLYLMGESMGAAVLMVMATEPHAPQVAGYVLVAPAVWGRAQMSFFLRGVLWLASHTVPGLTLENRGYVKITASDNHEALVRLSNDPLTIHATRVDTTQGLVNLMDDALAAAPKFHARALFIYGGKDDLIPKQATLATWRALPKGDATLAYYPDHYHLAMRDLGRDTVIKDAVAWMKDPTAPLPSRADQAALDWMQTKIRVTSSQNR
jgi:acylglycerol lipase